MLKAIQKANALLMKIIRGALILTGTTMTVLVIMNVILRYVFNSGLTWSEEASRFLFIWTTFLGAILANDHAIHSEHMRMDFIVDMVHGVPRKIVEVLALVVVLVLLCLLFSGSIHLVTSTWSFKTSALKLPKGGVYLCAPICFGYMALQTLAQIINALKAKDEDFAAKEAE